MVGIGARTPAQSFAAIDHDTILLLFAIMLLIADLERGGPGPPVRRVLLDHVVAERHDPAVTGTGPRQPGRVSRA